ncbi:MAG: SAM-dependent methyltransferase, partial [Deltaproteobacteria bacterium]
PQNPLRAGHSQCSQDKPKPNKHTPDLYSNLIWEGLVGNSNRPQKCQLFIVGTPLSDEGMLSSEAIQCINQADLIIAESKRNGFRFLKQTERKESTPLFFLDPFREQEWKELEKQFRVLANTGGKAVLFSDTGMPLLFDPGIEVLNLAKELKFSIRSVPSATSWGSACALSGWQPPFLVLGFLSRDLSIRKSELSELKGSKSHAVLMDTPYRFEPLLAHIAETLGPDKEVFLAWELSKPEEILLWGTVHSIQREAEKLGLKKGEFILIIRGKSKVK